MIQFGSRKTGIFDQMRRPVWALTSIMVFLGGQVVLPALTSEAQAQTLQRGRNPLPGAPAPSWAIKAPPEFHVGKIKPSAPPACKDCEVSMQALDLERVPTERELRMAGQLGGALNPIGNADVIKLTARLNQEMTAQGISPEDAAAAPPTSAAGKLQRIKKEKIERLQKINSSFGAAIQQWNKHNFSQAAGMFQEHLEEYPDSPWAGEVTLHLACDDTYNGRFSEAQSKLQYLLQNTTDQRPSTTAMKKGNANSPVRGEGQNATDTAGEDSSVGSYEIHQKAKLRWADLNLSLGRITDAQPQLADILRTDSDWRRLTWARHWFHMASILKRDKRLASCGPQALAALMRDLDHNNAAKRIAVLQSPRDKGFSMQELATISARSGVKLVGLQASSTSTLDTLPTPFIVHYDFVGTDNTTSDFDLPTTNLKGFDASLTNPSPQPRNPEPHNTVRPPFRITDQQIGHYLIAQKVDKTNKTVHLYDPLEKRYYTLSYAQLSRQWSGKVLAVAKLIKDNPTLTERSRSAEPSRSATNSGVRFAKLSESIMKSTFGGCCGVPRNQDGLGGPGSNGCGGDGPGGGCGAPMWNFNMVSMNMFLTDTPLWYSSEIGPDVNITLSYNSDDAISQASPVGEKWVLNYRSYLVEDTTQGGGVVKVIMPDGRQDAYTPDGSGGYIAPAGNFNTLTKTGSTHYEVIFPDGGKFVYDIPSGSSSLQPFLVQIADRWGKALTLGYQDSGTYTNLTTITDALGRVTHLSYDNYGHLILVTDPFERQMSLSYDAYGNLVECIDMEGQAFQYTYDALHVITELATTAGNWTFVKEGPDGDFSPYYPAPGTPMWENIRWTVTDPLGGKKEYFYDGYNARSWLVSPNHYQEYTANLNNGSASVPKTIYHSSSVNSQGKVTSVTTPNGDTYHTGYDYTSTLPTSQTDARGKTTSYSFNGLGQPTGIIDPMNHATTIAYAANGLDAVSVQDAEDNTVLTSTYNSYHQPLTVTDADNNTTSFTYTNWGAPATITDASGIVTAYNYNALGQVTSIQRNGKTLSSYTYDAVGHVATSTDANGVTLSYQYNNLGHLTKVTYPDGTYEETIYVCCNLPGLVKDRAGCITYYDYDALKRLIRVQDSAGNTVSFQYDANGNRIKLIDAKGSQTQWSYDASNRVIRKTYADQHNQQYNYSGGLLSATQNEKGQVTHYQYDNDSKLTKIDYPNMTDVTFSYDGLDRLASMTDGMGTTSYTYTDLNQLNSVSGIWQNDGVGYSYDNLGRRTGMSAQRDASNNDVTNYAYDDLSRLSSISSGAGTFGYSYVGNSSMLTQIDLPNGEKSTFTYDALEQLTQIHNLTSADANVSQYSYAYDNTTHLPGRVSETSQVGTDDSIVRNYGYDPVDQLISETVTQNGQTTQNKTYAYDPMGNRTDQTYQYSPDPVHTVSYSNNSLNQTTAVSSTDGTTTTQSTFTYDANGNTTQINADNSTTQYTYDDADRLIAIVYKDDQGVNTAKSTFEYDGLNRLRVSHKYTWNTQTSDWVQQSEKRRIYDGMDVVQERDENNAVTNSYTRNGNIGGILSMVHYTPDGSGGFTSDKYFYHYDGRGNVTQLTNEGQNIVATYTYDAFGNTVTSGAGAGLNAYRFSTKEQISGLYYYGYRFYSPGLGKWINRDPIQEAGGINVYRFTENAPINNGDEYGLNPLVLSYGDEFQRQMSVEMDGMLDALKHSLEYTDRGDPRWQPVQDAAFDAEEVLFPNGEPYNGGYRHCVASCLLKRRYGPGGNVGVWLHDKLFESSGAIDSPSDKEAEQAGLRVASGSDSCAEECAKKYPPCN